MKALGTESRPRSNSRQETDCCLGSSVEVKKRSAGGPGRLPPPSRWNAGSGNPQRSPSLAAWLAPLFSSSKREGDLTDARHSLHHSGGHDSNARRRSLNCGTVAALHLVHLESSFLNFPAVHLQPACWAWRPATVNDGRVPAPNHVDESCAPDQVEVKHLSKHCGHAHNAKARSAVGFTHARHVTQAATQETPKLSNQPTHTFSSIPTPQTTRQEHRRPFLITTDEPSP